MNRFSRDTNNMDDSLTTHMYEFLQMLMIILGVLILPIVVKNWMVFPLIPLLLLFLIIQSYFISSARELKHLDNIARTPIYVHTTNTIDGIRTIRSSCNKEIVLRKEFATKSDEHSKAFFGFIVVHRWFGLRLDLLCTFYAILTLFSFIFYRG